MGLTTVGYWARVLLQITIKIRGRFFIIFFLMAGMSNNYNIAMDLGGYFILF